MNRRNRLTLICQENFNAGKSIVFYYKLFSGLFLNIFIVDAIDVQEVQMIFVVCVV